MKKLKFHNFNKILSYSFCPIFHIIFRCYFSLALLKLANFFGTLEPVRAYYHSYDKIAFCSINHKIISVLNSLSSLISLK